MHGFYRSKVPIFACVVLSGSPQLEEEIQELGFFLISKFFSNSRSQSAYFNPLIDVSFSYYCIRQYVYIQVIFIKYSTTFLERSHLSSVTLYITSVLLAALFIRFHHLLDPLVKNVSIHRSHVLFFKLLSISVF